MYKPHANAQKAKKINKNNNNNKKEQSTGVNRMM